MAYMRIYLSHVKNFLSHRSSLAPFAGFHSGKGPICTTEYQFPELNKRSKEANSNEGHLSFSDYRTAFKDKRTSEICRALFILKLCSYDNFVNNSLTIMTTAEKILGKKLFGTLIRPTFYNQFVGGDDELSLIRIINRLKMNNVNPMIACMMEDDDIAVYDEVQSERTYNNNLRRILNCVELLGSTGNNSALQVKVTGLIPVKIVVKLESLITNSNFLDIVRFLADFITEESSQFSLTFNTLNDQEKTTLKNGLERLHQIAKFSKQKNVTMLIDAEYLSMRKALNVIALALMMNHNKESPLVWDTVQCYLKDAFSVIEREIQVTEKLDVCYGVKIVRGAYMEKEKQLAIELNYPDPVNSSYEETGELYNRIVDYMLNRIKLVGSKTKIVIATHNENAIHHAVNSIHKLNLKEKEDLITFGQLYGMCDQVTFPLSNAGWTVYKSIPFGSISEVLPYLYRRATENRAVLKGTRRERVLLQNELKRRIFL